MYATNQLCQFVSSYDETHITAAKRVIRYLQGSKSIKNILRRGNDLTLLAFVDADFANEPERNDYPMRSLAAVVMFLVGIGVIYANVFLDKTVSTGTSMSEYKAIFHGAQVVSAYRQQLDEIGFPQSHPTCIHSDNQAAIAMARLFERLRKMLMTGLDEDGNIID
jgi:hypothetical protein